MASGTTGDRRWGSARRGGMTVLGKVAVPKPINLPSQRLENHGLDPNVEIVPKGTLSWGSRSSASTPNAWGSSLLSPSADGSISSPSHLSARPSSGESGTRPSTAGSDRALDSINAWGSNSRPSSASGALSSSQTSLASLRPRSAETRPGSSQLSRFADSVLDNSVARGVERLGPTCSKNERFSLSSGDFPVLGSEKNGCGRSEGSQEHAPQGSELSSDTVVSVKEGDSSVNADPRNRVENSWRRDNAPCGEDGGPGAEKWQGDHPPHQNSGILPQQFNAWHGPLVNNPPGGVWFRGPPGGHPYGAPVAPGGFPVEPFPYYRPQIPPSALPTLQSIPPPGAGPRGHHSSSGDMYRPQMPDGFIRPGMPLRPGYYSGPMPYEGYFGPPMNYHNSNERDIAYAGMAGPPRFPGQNAPDIPHRSGGYGSTNKASDGEEVDLGHPHDTRGQYKVILKQQESWDGKGGGHKREGSVTKDESSLDKEEPGKKASWKNHWRADCINEEKDLENAEPVEEASQKFDYRGDGTGPTRVKALENVQRPDDTDSARGLYKSSVPEAPKSSVAAPKDSSLIRKIEGLNAKARVSDDRHEYTFVSNRSEEDNNFQGPDTMANHSAKEVGSDALHVESIHAGKMTKPSLSEMDAPSGGKSLEQADVSEATIPRRYPHGVQGKSYYRGRGRSSTQDVDERWKRSKEPDQLVVVPDASLEFSNIHVPQHMSGKANDICAPLYQGKDDGGTVSIAYDPSESEAERAKMKELAKQRVKQRQFEEEERARDQKAKARMKLEELNRRAQAIDGSIGKGENVSTGATLNKQHNLQPFAEMTKSSTGSVVLSSQSVSSTITVSQVSDGIVRSIVPSNLSREPPDGACEEHALVGNQSGLLKQDTKTGGASDPIEDGRTFKQKRMGSKHKSHISSGKNFNEKCPLEPSKALADGADSVTKPADVPYESTPSCEDRIPVNPHGMAESIQQRRKGNKTSRNKHKVDESSALSALPVLSSKEIIVANPIEESIQRKSPESNLDSTQLESPPDSGDAKQPSERHPAVAGEEVHTRVNYQWKSQHSRRIPRNQQANRFADRLHGSESVVWAPVRSQNKTEVSDEASDRALVEGVNSTVKTDNPVQNNPKNKRAEIERYVPKPAAKEMAQQGSIHQHTVTSSSINSGDASVAGGGGSGSQSIENAQPAKASSRSGDGRLNKAGKAHGSWRQRGPKESTLHDLVDGQSYTSDISKEVQKLSGHHQAEERELISVDEMPKCSDELFSGDGSNLPINSNSAAEVAIHPARDQGVAGRGKRHAFRAYKAAVVIVDRDQKKSIEEMDESWNQSLAPEAIQRSPVVPKESHVVSERSTSHWQPKSHSSSAHISRGSRVTGGSNIQADGGGIDAELPHGGLPALAQHEKEHCEALSTNDNRKHNSRKDYANEAGHVEGKMETKGPVRSTGDVRHESQFPSGFHKGGRNARGNGSHGDWNSSGQENNRHRERQRPNSHFRYQPVGTYSDNRSNHVEGSKDGSQSTGMKFKEKSGQGSSRRGGGNYTDRQVGTGRVDADCN